jgi:hypothetical protein
MLKSGTDSPLHTISIVKHELAEDYAVTRFSITDTVMLKIGENQYVPDKYTGKDGKQHILLAYYRVTVFENIPLTDRDCIRLLYYSDLAQINVPIEYKDKHGVVRKTKRRCYSISAKIERIEGK